VYSINPGNGLIPLSLSLGVGTGLGWKSFDVRSNYSSDSLIDLPSDSLAKCLACRVKFPAVKPSTHPELCIRRLGIGIKEARERGNFLRTKRTRKMKKKTAHTKRRTDKGERVSFRRRQRVVSCSVGCSVGCSVDRSASRFVGCSVGRVAAFSGEKKPLCRSQCRFL
jgi:hypothetical protein